MTLFSPAPITASEAAEAKRLSWLSLGLWFGGWVAPYLIGASSLSGLGELGLQFGLAVIIFTLVTGTITTVFGLRCAFRAYSIDSSLFLPKIVFFLYLATGGVVGCNVILLATIG